MDKLFVVNKPIFISSNSYLKSIKREFGVKKLGYSGTLDPFATGSLIIATGKYTKLFNYLKKSPKLYRATLWLGLKSSSLDIENVIDIIETPKLETQKIKKVIESMIGEIYYRPPKYSAKKLNGKRAYELARINENIELPKIKSTIYQSKLIHYKHPFIHFEMLVSEGSYIRSFGAIIAKKLGVDGGLSSLFRIREGDFDYRFNKPLNPLKYLNIPENIYKGDIDRLRLGQRLFINDFKIKKSGEYWVEGDSFFTIIEIDGETISYKLNLMPKFYN